MKLEEAMYVRHHHFGIGRIINIYEKDNRTWFNVKFKCYEDDECHCGICEQSIGFKASHNIIELIEVGDYVNGYEVIQIDNGRLYFDVGDFSPNGIENNQIKSIVTKEQFENISYKVK